MEWFMERISKGRFPLFNPYSGKSSLLTVTPETIHSIVFWSKNFGPFLRGGYGEALQKRGYNIFFNFTINTESPLLEPGIPPLAAKLSQLGELCSRFGAASVNWRFDPLCFYRHDNLFGNNLADFPCIAETAEKFGVTRCITSFMDHYRKIQRRVSGMNLVFSDPPIERKVEIILRMERLLTEKGITLFTCCEKEVMDLLPAASRVRTSSCISGPLLMELFGGRVTRARDRGQRQTAGCGCTASKDVGSYDNQPCGHGCLYCYANPGVPVAGTAGRGDNTARDPGSDRRNARQGERGRAERRKGLVE